jgi:hypothetical protein
MRPSTWNQLDNDLSKISCGWNSCCEQCQVGCIDDNSCRGWGSGLKCKIREADEAVPGCIGVALSGQNYCYNEDPTCWLPYMPTPAPVVWTPSPTIDKTIVVNNCDEWNRCSNLPICSGKVTVSRFRSEFQTYRRS